MADYFSIIMRAVEKKGLRKSTLRAHCQLEGNSKKIMFNNTLPVNSELTVRHATLVATSIVYSNEI